MIVELIAHSCQLHKDQFDATDDEAADRLIHCANAALPYFSVSNLVNDHVLNFQSMKEFLLFKNFTFLI